MKIVLVGPELEENLSLRYLKSSLDLFNHQTEIVPFNGPRDTAKVARTVLKHRPGLVGYSLVAQHRFPDFKTLTRKLRDGGFAGHITAGGHFASLRSEEILRDVPGIDSIIHHDGEVRLNTLAANLEKGKSCADEVDGISWRGEEGKIFFNPPTHVSDLDDLSFPARRTPDRTMGFRRAPMVTSRGCAGACSFCSIRAWHRQIPSGRLRFRSPHNVVEEMIALNRDHQVRIFNFHDDDFIHPNPRTAFERCYTIFEEAEQRLGEPIAFVIKCRPDQVNERLFAYLKSKGLVRVYVGIENHSTIGLKTLNRHIRPEQNIRALDILKSLKIFSCFNLLIFHPDTTRAEFEVNLQFLRDHLEHPFDVARTELYARSALEERLINEGRAVGSYQGYDYVITDPQAEALFQLFKLILWDRHFGKQSLVQRSQDIGYRYAVLERLLPAVSSDQLHQRIQSFITEVNSDTVDYLNDLSQCTRTLEYKSGSSEVSAYAEYLKKEIQTRLRRQSAQWAALILEMQFRSMIGRSKLQLLPLLAERSTWFSKLATSIPSIAIALSSLACSDKQVVCDPPPPPTTYTRFIGPTLNQNCATSGCHDKATASSQLVLTSDTSYENIVNVRSIEVLRLNRIKPGQPDSSYMMNKLNGTQVQAGGSGETMPKGGTQDASFYEKLRTWILRGAPKD